MQTLSSQKGVIKPPGKKKPPTEMDFRNKYKTEVGYFSLWPWLYILMFWRFLILLVKFLLP